MISLIKAWSETWPWSSVKIQTLRQALASVIVTHGRFDENFLTANGAAKPRLKFPRFADKFEFRGSKRWKSSLGKDFVPNCYSFFFQITTKVWKLEVKKCCNIYRYIKPIKHQHCLIFNCIFKVQLTTDQKKHFKVRYTFN